MVKNNSTVAEVYERKHTCNSLPREYSERSQGKVIHSVMPTTSEKVFLEIVKGNFLIKEVEAMSNSQKVSFAAFYHRITNSKFNGVYDGSLKSVGAYARLYGDKDYDTASYLELNKRFRLRVCPYAYLKSLISLRPLGLKEIMFALLDCAFASYISEGVIVAGYNSPMNKTAIQHLIDSNSVTVIKAEIEGEDEPRFLGTPAEWEWLLSKKFKAYSR
jgi:hypothetical protein